MRDGCAEDKATLPILRKLHNLAAGRRDESLLTHKLFNIFSNKLSRPDVQSFSIGNRLSGMSRHFRNIALIDQFLNRYLIADFVEEVLLLADKPALSAIRRCRPTDKSDIGIDGQCPVKKCAIAPFSFGRHEMNLIHHHDIEWF